MNADPKQGFYRRSSAFIGGRYIFLLAVVFYRPAIADESSQPIRDEALSLEAIRTIFLGMQVAQDPEKKINNSWPTQKSPPPRPLFPDALAGENVYRVTGKTTNEIERCASENISEQRFSDTRTLRFRLFHWPGPSDGGLLAVLQYDLIGASPAGSCWSIGLLVQLVRSSTSFKIREEYLLSTQHHSSLQRAELIDLTGDSVPDLIIESSTGGGGYAGSSLQVFDLAHGKFDELLDVNSRVEYLDQEGYSQSLDVARTLTSSGQKFCATKTTFYEKGRWFPKPRVTRPCYPRGEGVNLEDQKFLKQKLSPLP